MYSKTEGHMCHKCAINGHEETWDDATSYRSMIYFVLPSISVKKIHNQYKGDKWNQ